MYGHLSHRVEAAIERLGGTAEVLDRTAAPKDGFGNPDSDFTYNGTDVRCFRTYPNRNTEISNSAGDLERDRPVFVFPRDDAPDPDARIRYLEPTGGKTTYELQAETKYDTHIEIFGEKVVNP